MQSDTKAHSEVQMFAPQKLNFLRCMYTKQMMDDEKGFEMCVK